MATAQTLSLPLIIQVLWVRVSLQISSYKFLKKGTKPVFEEGEYLFLFDQRF